MPEGSFLQQAWPVVAQGEWWCLSFTYCVLELMKTSNSKKEKHRSENSMMGRRCKHAKRKNLLVEQEVRRETHVCELLGCLPWPERPLQIKGACCSVLFWKQQKLFKFFSSGKRRDVCMWLGKVFRALYLPGRNLPSSMYVAKLLTESLDHVAMPPVPVQGVFHISEYSASFIEIEASSERQAKALNSQRHFWKIQL